MKLDPRTLGRSDYPTREPLDEVRVLLAHCAGAVVLGFTQGEAFEPGVPAKSTGDIRVPESGVRFLASPWNQLEGALAFGMRLPLLILREKGVTGGIFDPGAAGAFVHEMPSSDELADDDDKVVAVLTKWQADVRSHYYSR